MTGFKAGRPRWWVTGLVLLATLLGVGFFLVNGPDTAVLPPPAGQEHRPYWNRSPYNSFAVATNSFTRCASLLGHTIVASGVCTMIMSLTPSTAIR